MADVLQRERAPKGERCSWSKLSDADAAEILKAATALKRGDKTKLAKRYGVTISTVCDIMTGRNWGWLRDAVSDAPRPSS